MSHHPDSPDDLGYEDHGFSGREPSRGGYDDHGYGRGDYRDRSYQSRGFFRDRGAPNQGPHGRYDGDDLPDSLESGTTREPREGEYWYRGGDAGEECGQPQRDVRGDSHRGGFRAGRDGRELGLEPHAPAAGGWSGDVRGALRGGFHDSGDGDRGFAGVGPRGWRRSDARIHEEICESLTRHPAIDPSDVEVEVKEGVVRLTGLVHDRAAKWLAEDIAEGTFGVRDVHNEIRIRRAD